MRAIQRLRSGRRFVLVLLCVTNLGCSSGSTTTPTRTTGSGVGPVVNIAGNWMGTFDSANFSTRTIKMTVVQSGNCVDGVWDSTPEEWSGAISGFAKVDSYVGQFSIERTLGDGSKCTAVGNVTGPVGSQTLRWTGDDLEAVGPCNGDIPRVVVLTLNRQ